MFYFVFKLKFSVGSFFGSSFWFIFWYQILAPKIEPRDHFLVPNFGTKNQTTGSLLCTKFWHQKSIRETNFWYQIWVHIFAQWVLGGCVLLQDGLAYYCNWLAQLPSCPPPRPHHSLQHPRAPEFNAAGAATAHTQKNAARCAAPRNAIPTQGDLSKLARALATHRLSL